jgi:3' terminal RNA ribose 2'-O-methyltransferase Hen1
MAGTCKERPELAASAIPLEASIAVLPCRDGESLIRRLFEPLGYAVTVESTELDDRFPQWGESPYHAVQLSGTVRLSDLLQHLYVLIPVLDQEKHYWVAADEVDKLMRHGADWLPSHPEQELIVRRYLSHVRSLATDALQRLAEGDQDEQLTTDPVQSPIEDLIEQPLRLSDQRQAAILAALEEAGASRILDLGCGEGRLLTALLDRPGVTEVVGMDVAPRVLEEAAKKLRLDRMPPLRAQRLKLIQGSLVYRDERLGGYDGAVLQEVIEHLDPPQLRAAERVLFEFARPGTVIVTTPNREYNALFATLASGTMRHEDHRFEWSRGEFLAWAEGIATRRGYSVRHVPVGPNDPDLGSPTQMAVFQR